MLQTGIIIDTRGAVKEQLAHDANSAVVAPHLQSQTRVLFQMSRQGSETYFALRRVLSPGWSP